MKFLGRLGSSRTDTGPKYQHLDLSVSHISLEDGHNPWKQRFFALSIVYLVTLLGAVTGFLFKSGDCAPLVQTVRTDTLFGNIPLEPVVFKPNQTHSDVAQGSGDSTSNNGSFWDTLQPRGGGFIIVPNPKNYGLVGGYPLGMDNDGIEREGYSIALYHQIHCLVMIRTAFGAQESLNEHLNHCFDYLRQSISCAGDTTLESVLVDAEGRFRPETDGWGVTHVCRSWSMLYEFAQSHRVPVVGD